MQPRPAASRQQLAHAHRSARSVARSRAQLLVVLVGGAGLFLVALDFSINVSLPTMRDSLGASLVTVQWIIILYHATRSGTGFGAGGIGDRFGLKRLFMAGVIAYTGGAAVLFGFLMLGIDVHAGLPLRWTLGEGPVVLALGLAILLLLRKVRTKWNEPAGDSRHSC